MYEVWDEDRIVYISVSYSKAFDFWNKLAGEYFKVNPNVMLPTIKYFAMQQQKYLKQVLTLSNQLLCYVYQQTAIPPQIGGSNGSQVCNLRSQV